MLMIESRQIAWWYWLATVCLLSAGLAGVPFAFACAIALTAWQAIHFALRCGSATAFPVQVRFFYMLLLIVSLPAPMRPLYWLPTIGTWAQVLFGYCLMARSVSLLPWNRLAPLSWPLVRRTFFSRPVRGSVLQGLSGVPRAAAPAK
ncbi:MAG: hypothetical protein U1F54_00330 [Burkholderiales bacterium]